nr:craniofacial development protein 2-like [Tanacetum cinerariifolium]
MVKARLRDNVVHVNRCSDRIISLTSVIDGETVNVISVYAPQVDLSEEENKTFWNSLDEVVREFLTDQRLFLVGDLNGHIRASTEGYSGVYGGFSYVEGRAVLRILWKNLDRDATEAFRLGVVKGVSTKAVVISASDANSLWNIHTSNIKDTAKDTLGVAIGTSKTHTTRREYWWLCEEVQSKVAAKQARMEVAELRMLRWTYGKTMLDMIPNGVYRVELEVKTIINKMREGQLRWFGHVRRSPQSVPVRRVEGLVFEGVRRRGRPKLRREDRVKHDMKELLLSEDINKIGR